MQSMSRLGVALLATAATLGAGSLVVVPQAFGSTSATVGSQALIDGVLDPVLDPLDPVLDPLDPVLDPLDPVLDPLDPVLDPLDPVLDPLDPVLDPLDPVVNPGVAPVASPTGGTASPPVTNTTPPPTRAITARPRPGAYAAYRIKISGVKAAKHRRSIRLTLSCPAAAPKGCLVTLKGVLAGKKAFATKTIIVMRNRKKTFTMKLTKATTKRLKKKSGSLKISAQTAFSSTPSTIKRVKIARAKR